MSAAERVERLAFERSHNPRDFLVWLNAYTNEKGRDDHELHALCSWAHAVVADLQNALAAGVLPQDENTPPQGEDAQATERAEASGG